MQEYMYVVKNQSLKVVTTLLVQNPRIKPMKGEQEMHGYSICLQNFHPFQANWVNIKYSSSSTIIQQT